MRFKILSAAVAAVALAPLATFAAPATTLYGGGATFPASAWHGNEFIVGPVGGPVPTVSPRLTSAGAPGSYFGAYTASTAAQSLIPFPAGATSRPAVSYCQTGSGTGKNVLTGNSSRVVTGTCPDFASTPTGFGAPAGTVDADFAGTDSPLTQSDYSAYLTNKAAAHVQPVQVPVVAGSIGVVYNNAQTGGSIGVAAPTITLSKVCQIFSGAISNWNQLGPFPSKTIKVVYRSDSSGTSFGMSNHLSFVCPTATPTAVTGFSTQQTFLSAFPGGVAPTGAIGASGNNGVLTTVAATDGAIGYADVSDAVDRASLNPALKEVQYFTLAAGEGTNLATGKKYKAKSPAKISKKFKIATGGVVVDRVLGANDANGRPTLVTLSPVPPKASCILLAKPDSYATAALTATGDFASYPIMAVSYMTFHSAGNGESALNLQALAAGFFGAITPPSADGTIAGTISGSTTTIAPARGFSYLAGFPNPTKTTIKNCIVP